MKYPVLTAALLSLSLASCSETNKTGNETGDADTAVLLQNDATVKNDGQPGEMGSPTDDANWNDIDVIGAPAAKYDEVTDRSITVRGTENYGVYDLEENVLFNTGEASIRTDAEAKLKSIAASINQRYNGGRVRIYGFTDAQGSAESNKQLSQQRAEAVRTWMQSNANIGADRLSIQAMGESGAVASNSTEAGKQQNRRVQIVARK